MQSARARTYIAGGAITARSFVKFSADGVVVVATAATDDIIGITAELDVVQGERVDVYRAGSAELRLGGTVARGAPLTAAAGGARVAAAPAAGVRNRHGAFAEVSGVSGDIIDVEIDLGFITG
ncbi:hypothetical protein OVA11_14215 [Caulobacter sp. SL161]|uniref:hypothetical protein n=1 Tax=Caulobacter sp. SL161 TaxID=2995156 RepID=UPI002272BCE6|nr:hypothetical protein [Caulobacter sp. SL161]MCY1648175.1 hypothetical protein [Caulobacter sp. SL161]